MHQFYDVKKKLTEYYNTNGMKENQIETHKQLLGNEAVEWARKRMDKATEGSRTNYEAKTRLKTPGVLPTSPSV